MRPVKRPGLGIAPLRLEPVIVDRRGAQPRGGPRLEPPEREAQVAEAVRQAHGRELARSPRRLLPEADVNQTPQECPRRHDHGAAAIAHADCVLHADHAAALDQHAAHLPLAEVEPPRVLDHPLHRRAVAGAVALRARGADGGAARGIERPELDGREVGDAAHLAAERVDLADQVALRRPADGGVARHLADAVEAHRQHERGRAHARRRQRGLAPGMARADHDHVP